MVVSVGVCIWVWVLVRVWMWMWMWMSIRMWLYFYCYNNSITIVKYTGTVGLCGLCNECYYYVIVLIELSLICRHSGLSVGCVTTVIRYQS